MNSVLSITYKAFPELAKLPQAVAESRFKALTHDFYYSNEGIKACAVVLGSLLIGLSAGLPFGIIPSSLGASAGVFIGSLAFNVMMRNTIGSRVRQLSNESGAAAPIYCSQSPPRQTFAVLTDEERAIRRAKQAAYLARKRGKIRSQTNTSA